MEKVIKCVVQSAGGLITIQRTSSNSNELNKLSEQPKEQDTQLKSEEETTDKIENYRLRRHKKHMLMTEEIQKKYENSSNEKIEFILPTFEEFKQEITKWKLRNPHYFEQLYEEKE